jgi:hypothetical protein
MSDGVFWASNGELIGQVTKPSYRGRGRGLSSSLVSAVSASWHLSELSCNTASASVSDDRAGWIGISTDEA